MQESEGFKKCSSSFTRAQKSLMQPKGGDWSARASERERTKT